jgi:hypothetical protein
MSESTSTEVQPYIERGKIALRKADATMKDLVLAVTDELPISNYVFDIPFPAVAPVRTITEAQTEALKVLPEVFGKVQPGTRRTLKPEEITTLFKEREVLKTIGDLLDGREEDIKTIVRHHMDVDAEERGVAVPKSQVDPATGQVIVQATERDQNGHYVLCAPKKPERLNVPGTDQAWSREYRTGGVNDDQGERLLALYEAGDITREDYLAFTREVRVYDPAKAMESIKKNPERLALLRKISQRTGVSTALFVRKQS